LRRRLATTKLFSVQIRYKVLGLAGCLAVAIGVATGFGAASPGARYVLTARDVGSAYTRNESASGGRNLADVSLGDAPAIRRELRRNWLGGTVAAFNSLKGRSGIISIADVFRPRSAINAVLRAWQRDAVRVTRGAFQRVPARAPGRHPALIRGRILNYEVLVYMWSRGNTIASVELTGKPGDPDRDVVLRLARRQDAKLMAS
jgi:hypothetical protein